MIIQNFTSKRTRPAGETYGMASEKKTNKVMAARQGE